MRTRLAMAGVLGLCAAIAAAQACVLPGYSTSTSGATSGGGTPGAGGAGGVGGNGGNGGAGGGTSTSSGGGGGGAPACVDLPGFEEIACGQAKPDALAVSDAGVFWINEGTNTVMRADKTGQSVGVFVPPEGTHVYLNLTISGNALLIRTNQAVLVKDVNAAPNTPAAPLTGTTEGDSPAIGADGQYVYWFRIGAQYWLMRSSLEVGSAVIEPLVDTGGVAHHLDTVPGSDYVFWTGNGKGVATRKSTTTPSDPPSPPAPNGVILNDGTTRHIAASVEYGFASDESKNQVRRFKFEDSEGPSPYVQGQTTPGPVKVLGTSSVYWLNNKQGAGYLELKREMYSDTATQLAGTVVGNAGDPPFCALAVDGTDVYVTTCASGMNNGQVLRWIPQ